MVTLLTYFNFIRTYYMVKLDEKVHGESLKTKKMYKSLDWFCGGAIFTISLIYISTFVLMLIQKQTGAKWNFE